MYILFVIYMNNRIILTILAIDVAVYSILRIPFKYSVYMVSALTCEFVILLFGFTSYTNVYKCAVIAVMSVLATAIICSGNYLAEKFTRQEFLNHNQLLMEKRKAIEANLAKQQFIRYIFHEVLLYY